MKILNCTQHHATPDQIMSGVVEANLYHRELLKEYLTFESLPSMEEVAKRAAEIAEIISPTMYHMHCTHVMIGGAPYLMPFLHKELENRGFKPLYAFSKREVKETPMEDGTVKKEIIFQHSGFIGNLT